jgi:hypothetical protein
VAPGVVAVLPHLLVPWLLLACASAWPWPWAWPWACPLLLLLLRLLLLLHHHSLAQLQGSPWPCCGGCTQPETPKQALRVCAMGAAQLCCLMQQAGTVEGWRQPSARAHTTTTHLAVFARLRGVGLGVSSCSAACAAAAASDAAASSATSDSLRRRPDLRADSGGPMRSPLLQLQRVVTLRASGRAQGQAVRLCCS